jgi:hypothetical protein
MRLLGVWLGLIVGLVAGVLFTVVLTAVARSAGFAGGPGLNAPALLGFGASVALTVAGGVAGYFAGDRIARRGQGPRNSSARR